MAKCACCGKSFFSVINAEITDALGGKHRICMDCYKKGTGKSFAYDFGTKKVSIIDVVEFRKKCKVCGKVFCYTSRDLQRNHDLATQAKRQSSTAIASALAGSGASSAINIGNAEANINRIIDYSRCPECGSSELENISKEDYLSAKKMENQKVKSSTALSSADEIKKFKELLDSGVITQEEFDAKKKQLLGL